MNNSGELVPTPLYHGTSSHFLSAFKPGATPAMWPHKRAALRLLEDVWTDLSQLRDQVPCDLREKLAWGIAYEEIPFYVRNVIDQVSGHSNWQHGELYLTPSKLKAVEYACRGAKHGGELVTMCRNALNALTGVDQQKAERLTGCAESLPRLLRGTDLPPILVEFDDIRIADLSTEVQEDDVSEALSLLTDKKLRETFGSDERVREIVGQQTNFRLANGCGVVGRVFEVHVEDQDNPSSPFALKEIDNSDQWAN